MTASCRPNTGGALVVGRALHGPWNEGTRVIARDLARALATLRPVQVVSLTHASLNGHPDDGLAIDHVPARFGGGVMSDYAGLAEILRLARLRPGGRPVAVAHLVGTPLALAPWLRRRRIRVVAHVTLTAHAYMGRRARLRARLAQRVFDPWIDAYACTSPALRQDLIAGGAAARKASVVGPPIDEGQYRPIDRAAARRRLGWDPAAFVAVYVGTVSPLRFPAREIVRGLSLTAAGVPGVALHVVAPLVTHPYNAAWAEGNVRAAARGAPIPVHIHLEDLPDERKAAIFCAADVVLLPFNAPVAVEPPLTLLEAMACQATVAVAPHANRSELVTDGVNGISFRSAEELARRLTQLAALEPERRAALQAGARALVVERYSLAAIAREVEAVWASIGLEQAAGAGPAGALATAEERIG
jgi:glycosyltransferase involved in cell wall biosynthesis